MARTTWAIYTKPASSWVIESTGIYRPNENLSIQKNNTQTKVALADGSSAYMAPSTKYRDEPLTFVWLWEDGTTKTKVEAYINNQTNIKIIDHNAVEYIGRFVGMESVQMVGENPDRYDVKATFERMPGLA